MKLVLVPLAAALVGLTLPVPSATAAAGGAGKAYSGYSSAGAATPVKLEIFEPTIPIPSYPQLEMDFGYSKVKGDSSSSKGRASFLWPGDAVGEGLKTFVEQLGLPSQLGENGYPVQVNSSFPSGTPTETNSPLPGTAMTTTSGDKQSSASVGYSSDCDVTNGAPSQEESTSPLPALPQLGNLGLPELPGLTDLPLGLDGLGDLLGLVPVAGELVTPLLGSRETVSRSSARTAAPTTASTCPLPTPLAMLVDIGGYVADSSSVSDDKTVTTASRSALGDVKLLGGIVTMSGITARSVSTSDGTTGTSTGRADYGTLTIAGQQFAMGPEGYVAAGDAQPIPGLSDDPAAALEQLGISIDFPQPTFTSDGDKTSGVVEGLVVTLDLKTLAPVLKALPVNQLLQDVPFPPEAAMLKSLLGAVPNLSPKIVLHLGYADSSVDTVQPLKLPAAVPDNDHSEGDDGDEGDDAKGDGDGQSTTGGATGTTGGGGSAAPPAAAPVSTAPVAAPAAVQPALTDAALTAGLPPLFSIPGLLMVGAIAGALVAGSYVRRVGALALGGARACTHGLDSGLPDLRKVQ